jgi:hypothetical protein
VEDLVAFEAKGLGAKECQAETITIRGAGVLRQEPGCDLYVDRLLLPSGRQFESRAEWTLDKVVIPATPDFLPVREVAVVRELVGAIRRMLEDFPLEISQRLICLVGSMGTRIVMQEQHAFGEDSWSLPLNGLTKFPDLAPSDFHLLGPLKHHLSA